MSDVNALALYCAQKSALLNKIEAKVVASDGLNDVDGRFKGIFTNPPFHTGVGTDYKITQSFYSASNAIFDEERPFDLGSQSLLALP